MKHIKNYLKILVILLLLVVSIGSIYAADNTNSTLSDNNEYDDFDNDWDDDSDDNDDLDDDLDDDSDDDDDWDDDWDDDLDDDSDDDDDWDDDWDDDFDDDSYSDFTYLDFCIERYLIKYGNNSDISFTNSSGFLSEYQKYLSNPDNYTLNNNAEGYETYLKIYNSIISQLDDCYLLNNESNYLKFMTIYYLNTFGNINANYTWVEDKDEFNPYSYYFIDFDYLTVNLQRYLMRYGNNSDINFTASEEFLNAYQKYLSNQDNYTLNNNAEGYETYLKIYDSINSQLIDFYLLDNETNYLNFMTIYYLNTFGNANENFTWNVYRDEFNPFYDYYLSDFDYLILKIEFYLIRYGNNSDMNWTDTDDFLNEYQIYLTNMSNYTFNESAEGYETYLKIFDSITSTFDDYFLTENETNYLKFMVIYYLNHFGNVSANYTWGEDDDFRNFSLPIFKIAYFETTACTSYIPLNSNETEFKTSSIFYAPPNAHELLSNNLNSLVNQTNSTLVQDNIQSQSVSKSQNNFWTLILFILLILFFILI